MSNTNTSMIQRVRKHGEDIENLGSQLETKITQFSYCGNQEFTIEKHLNIFNKDIANATSIYWCWVIRVDDKIENSLGKYYMYYSTDHEGDAGFISLAYSDNLLEGWKSHGQIYKNGSYETETPSVVWDEVNKNFIMYFHSANSYSGEAQTSYYVTSKDGLSFDNKQKLLKLKMKDLVGDLHNGYFHPFKIGNLYVAYHLLGGAEIGRCAVSYSSDGYNWITDHRQIGYLTLKENRFMGAIHCVIINKFGIDWLVGMNTNFVSGSSPKTAYVGIVPMSDLYTPVGDCVKLFDFEDTTETDNLRQVSSYQEGNDIYIFYQCDNVLHCAVIK